MGQLGALLWLCCDPVVTLTRQPGFLSMSLPMSPT